MTDRTKVPSTRSILRHYRAASDTDRAAGALWYANAYAVCEQLAVEYGQSVDRVACMLAHLSPRQHWVRNVHAVQVMLAGRARPSGCLSAFWNNALRAYHAADPWTTFSRRASKTRAFAQAILGDVDAVTVDVWAARAAKIDPETLRTPAGYDLAASAYRRAAKRVGVPPRDLQAICWVHVRGRAA